MANSHDHKLDETRDPTRSYPYPGTGLAAVDTDGHRPRYTRASQLKSCRRSDMCVAIREQLVSSVVTRRARIEAC